MKHIVVGLLVSTITMFAILAGDREIEQAVRTFKIIEESKKAPGGFRLHVVGKTDSDEFCAVYCSKTGNQRYRVKMGLKILKNIPVVKTSLEPSNGADENYDMLQLTLTCGKILCLLNASNPTTATISTPPTEPEYIELFNINDVTSNSDSE